MITIKELAKKLIVKRCSPSLQHKIRQFHTVYQITHNRHFREPEMAALDRLISPGFVVADVGANVGVYTHAFSSAVGPHGKVYSFEPVSQTYAILNVLIRKAGLHNVVPFQAAVGSKPADSEIVIPEMEGFTGYYWAHVAQPGEQGRKEAIKIVTLDGLCRAEAIRSLDFIKCDVEGGELEVIRGALETIRSQKPACLIEVSKSTSEQVFRVFKDLGYRSFVFNGQFVETQHYRDREFSNYFFFHPASPVWSRVATPS